MWRFGFITAVFAITFDLCVDAFSPLYPTKRIDITRKSITRSQRRVGLLRFAKDEDVDDEIERMMAMAAKLRAEASALEAEKAQETAEIVERIFNKFDTNKDGEIDVDELKAGLESSLKVRNRHDFVLCRTPSPSRRASQMEFSEKRVAELLTSFDTSGDGALQLDEFVTIEQFRNKLDALARDEKKRAAEAAKRAKEEAEALLFAEAKLDLINEKEPTNADKIWSIVPYLFPLIDGLQYGRFILSQEDSSNLLVVALAILYTLYKRVPFSGFAAFLSLSFLSGNLRINRLIRYNMQQAIFVDIALIVPGLLSGIYGLAATALKVETPAGLGEIGNDAVFVLLLLVLAYCTGSSLLGIAPDKIPFISQAVSDRMPTLEMFDKDGRFVPTKKEDEDKD